MNIAALLRRKKFSLEDDLNRLERTMDHFGLKLAISKHLPGKYRELLYETAGRGGIMAQYRLDDAPQILIKIVHAEESNVPLEQVTGVFGADNVLYSIGMSTKLFNSVWVYLR